VYSKSRDNNFSFLKILKFGCFRTGIFFRFWNSGCFTTHWAFFKSKKKKTFGFFLSEKLDPENAYGPHIGIHYKSLLFWRGSVTIEVTNFDPPVKTSFKFLSETLLDFIQNPKRGSQWKQCALCRYWGNRYKAEVCKFLLAVEPLVKSQTSHRAPKEFNFSDPTTSQIRGCIWMNTNYWYYIYLVSIERQWAINIIINTSTKGKWQTLHWNLRPINENGASCEKQKEHFYLAGDWCV